MEEDLFKNEMPEWDTQRFRNDDHEGEAWKMTPRWETAELMYGCCREIFKLCKLLSDSLSGEWAEMHRDMMMQNVAIVGVKIIGAETGDLYVIRMECAAIIRRNMKELRELLITIQMMEPENSHYCDLLLEEIEKFKQQFKVWVSLFIKDDIADDWGLF